MRLAVYFYQIVAVWTLFSVVSYSIQTRALIKAMMIRVRLSSPSGAEGVCPYSDADFHSSDSGLLGY
jgi:hypothetical protein